ncbi:MAG: DUF883 family protein [Verrucomicrobiae bacterium]|nr:DUF883 family protein [Verrucomicrobiae bacterium]
MKPIQERIDEVTDRAQEQLKRCATSAKDKAGELTETSQAFIQDNPWKSIAGVLVLGLIVGAVLAVSARSN